MNILFFADRVSYGGGEKVRNWLAKQLVEVGHTVYYAVASIDQTYISSMQKVGMLDVVKSVEFPRYLKKKHPFRYSSAISKLYRDNQIDLLIYLGGSLVEQLIARRLGIKILLSERFYNKFRKLPSRVLKQIQYRIADGYVFQTPEASYMYGSRAHRMSVVIPNPIIDNLPEPQFDNLRKEIVNVGRLCRQKDQTTLIRAFAIFHKSHPDYRLVIYGSGELKDELLQCIHELCIDDCAEIVSGKTNISELINGAELFVLSSLAEGMPNALIEAMSMGVLSISTDCPVYGSRMLVEDGINAFLTPVGDENQLAAKMIEALDNEQADSIRHNAVTIRERLREDKIFNMWADYIESIMCRRS